ncbi:MAG: inner membrane-spanning protein YciB [Steroidobacteraceae bacterium]
MQTLTGLAPLVAFFVTYRLRGLYMATAVLMVTMLLVLGIDWLRQRKIPPIHALSAVLVLIFGSATLLLHNRAFIQWKPTVLLWIVGIGFLGSFWVGTRTLTERFLGPAVQEHLRVSPALWRMLNGWSVGFYAVAGALNLAVAHYARESTWVNFKIFGLTLFTFAFTALQVLWLTNRATPVSAEPSAR